MSANSLPFLFVGLIITPLAAIMLMNKGILEWFLKWQNKMRGVITDNKTLGKALPFYKKFYTVLFLLGLLFIVLSLFIIK